MLNHVLNHVLNLVVTGQAQAGSWRIGDSLLTAHCSMVVSE
jgi:hypothetical protein